MSAREQDFEDSQNPERSPASEEESEPIGRNRKSKKLDPERSRLEKVIEGALAPGVFIDYGASWDFVSELEEVRSKITGLIEEGDAQRAVELLRSRFARKSGSCSTAKWSPTSLQRSFGFGRCARQMVEADAGTLTWRV